MIFPNLVTGPPSVTAPTGSHISPIRKSVAAGPRLSPLFSPCSSHLSFHPIHLRPFLQPSTLDFQKLLTTPHQTSDPLHLLPGSSKSNIRSPTAVSTLFPCQSGDLSRTSPSHLNTSLFLLFPLHFLPPTSLSHSGTHFSYPSPHNGPAVSYRRPIWSSRRGALSG